MRSLPLFPLPITFFPGFPIQLNIYEDRYKAMIKDCLDKKMDFGVVLIQEGKEALGPIAKPHQVGTVAKILKVKEASGGRILLDAIGVQPFRIHKLSHNKEYLLGTIEMEEAGPSNEEENRQVQGLLPLFLDYLTLLGQEEQLKINFSNMPRDARCVCYIGAYFLQVSQRKKQQLLEIKSTKELIINLEKTYKQQIELINVVLNCYETEVCYLN